jgi:subtilisin-like proprotein convertase family protein/Ca2+-binding RTX toxin-like protein
MGMTKTGSSALGEMLTSSKVGGVLPKASLFLDPNPSPFRVGLPTNVNSWGGAAPSSAITSALNKPIQPKFSPFSTIPLVPKDSISGSARNLSDTIKQSIERSSILSNYSLDEFSQTKQWAIGISGSQSPSDLATLLGATNKGKTGFIPGTYLFEFSKTKSPQEIAQILKGIHDKGGTIDFFFPLVPRQHEARFIPNDLLFSQQWHLNNTGQGGGTPNVDANVIGAWDVLDSQNRPINGIGVTIAIVDDGLQFAHPDIAPAYQASSSFDFNDNDSNPTPSAGDGHGTSAGGVAGARGNNSIGVSGVAYGAGLSGIRLIAAPANDQQEANALTYQLQSNHIYSNSWGPADTGSIKDAPGPLLLAALQNGVTTGRAGKGNIYVWAGGNGRGSLDNSNYDGYANSRYVIAVAAHRNNSNGVFSGYSEPGANLLVTAPSNGGTLGVVTTDLMGADGYNGLTDQNYTNDFGGTSSATPLVSGVIALMLQANPNLTWRDVQHILVRSAEKNDPTNTDWTTNGAGRSVNHNYGFGAVDALSAVNLAKNWVNVGSETSFTSGTQTVNAAIPDNSSTGISRTVNVSQNLKVETVEVVFDAAHTYRGDLVVTLTSPSGTISRLAEVHNDSNDNYSSWVFTTKRAWDESSLGNWTLNVADQVAQDVGTWGSWKLNIFGTGTALPVVTVAATDAVAGEPANNGQYTLTRTGSTASALTVNIAMNGTATNGADYTAIPTTVTFLAGSATAVVNLNVIDDTLVEGTETAILNVAAGAGYTVGAAASATVNIADNDLPAITVAATDAVAGEPANNGQYTLTRTGSTASALTVNIAMNGTATNGADYTAIPTTVTFLAGSATAVVNLNVIDDTLVEGTETAILNVAAGAGYTVGAAASATVNIADNDLPAITVAATDAVAGEPANNGQYTLTRTGSTAGALTVNIAMNGTATNGADYTTILTPVNFAAGSATAVVNLNVIDDTLVEGTETAILTVLAGTGYTVGAAASATVNIADNDGGTLPVVSLASNYSGVSENGKTNLVYNFTRSGATTNSLTVNFTLAGTATRGNDYNAYGGNFVSPTTGNIVFAPGQTTAQIEIVTTGDTVKEANETIAFTLASGTGYTIGTPGAVTTTILNDDGVLNQQGTTGNDVIEAGTTRNLSGRAGHDILIGSNASDMLVGAAGNDTITSGAGFDVIAYSLASEGQDTITDFNVFQDTLQVSAAGFGGGLIAGESIAAAQFVLGTVATTASHRFIFNKPTGQLFFDVDGNGSSVQTLLATLTPNLNLTEDNIFAA